MIFSQAHRLACHYLTSCPSEKYTDTGISVWVATPHMVELLMLKQQWVLRSLFLVPLLSWLGMCVPCPRMFIVESYLFGRCGLLTSLAKSSLKLHHRKVLIVIMQMDGIHCLYPSESLGLIAQFYRVASS
jgi:hypothetical protein